MFRKQVILEIIQTDYLAVIANKSGPTQLVNVLKYINNSSGEELERFWGSFCSESVHAEWINKSVVEQLHIVLQRNQDKLVAQTFDGEKLRKENTEDSKQELRISTEEPTIHI